MGIGVRARREALGWRPLTDDERAENLEANLHMLGITQSHVIGTQSLRNAAREFVSAWEDASVESAWELHGTTTDVGVLIVSEATSRAGIVPVVFGPLPEQPYSVTCVEIAPREYDALVLGSLTLPDGWSVGRRVL